MILRVRSKNSDSPVTVSRLLTIKSGTESMPIVAANNTITFSDTREDYNEWYSVMLDRKRVAMHIGGVIDGIANFDTGIKVYTHKNGLPYLLSFDSCYPDTNGNIQLLPGRTLDIYAQRGIIMCSQIKIQKGTSRSNMLADINRCIWYLYHTFNSFLYRMNIWDPYQTCQPMCKGARMLGIIQAYQATVAAWNLKIWRSSFLWEVAQANDSITFHVGYVALNCVNPAVECFVTIVNTAPSHNYSGEVDSVTGPKLDVSALNTTELYTLYDQGVASNIEGVVSTTVDKILPGDNDGGNKIPILGKGTDAAAEIGRHWNTIIVRIPLGKLNQGEYYRAAFALAVAQNNTTSKYYVGTDLSEKYPIKITTQWIVDTEVMYELSTPNLTIPKLQLYVEKEGEEEDNFIQ